MLKSIGLYFRKIDFLNFAIGAIMPIIVLFIVYSSVKSNKILQDTDFLSLLMNHKGKFIFYFFVSFIKKLFLEELKICGSVKISAAITQLKYLFLHFCSNSPKIIPLKITSSKKDTKK